MPLYISGTNGFSSNNTNFSVLPNSSGFVSDTVPYFYAQHDSVSNGQGSYGNFTGVFATSGHASSGTWGGSYSYTRFVCPYAGKYMVWVGNIGQSSGVTQRTHIYVNGAIKSAQLRNPQDTGNHQTSASLISIVDCQVNDWIATIAADDSGSFGFYATVYAHFGVLYMG